jgi:hypothetical protein
LRRIFTALAIAILVTACAPLSTGSEKANVDRVTVSSTGSNPTKYFVVVTGMLPDGCSNVGRNSQNPVGGTLRINLYVESATGSCSFPFTTPFKETIRVNLRDLSPGVYNLEVNGVIAAEKLTIGR